MPVETLQQNLRTADGVSTVGASLLKVLKTRQPDAVPVIRYDVKGDMGPIRNAVGKSSTYRSWATMAMCAG